MAEDLQAFEKWFGHILGGLAPAKRRSALLKLGQAIRRSNIERISANIEPDGGAMEKRKASLSERGRVRTKAGSRMFRRLRLAKAWQIDAGPDEVEIAPASAAIDRVAAVHHFGEVDRVGRLRDGRTIRVRYARRRLLGFGEGDRNAAVEAAASILDPDGAR